MKRRIVSIVMALLVAVSMLPSWAAAYAEDSLPEAAVAASETIEASINAGETLDLVSLDETVNPELIMTWDVSDQDVASVDDNGVLTALSEGECKITALDANGEPAAVFQISVMKNEDIAQTSSDNSSDETTDTDVNVDDPVIDEGGQTGENGESGDPEAGITEPDLSAYSIELSKSSVIYNGEEKKPTVTVLAKDGTILDPTAYSVEYSNNTNIGTATVQVSGTGDYYGTLSDTFKIVPGKATVKKIATFNKGATVYINGVNGGASYQLQYKLKGGNWKTISIGTSTSKKFTKFTNQKYYLFRTRAYKKVEGDTYYGDWSNSSTAQIGIPIKNCKITGLKTKVYTGKNVSQKINVTYNGKKATFKISYGNRKKIGKRYVKITGTGKYVGTVTKYYKIIPTQIKMTGMCPYEWFWDDGYLADDEDWEPRYEYYSDSFGYYMECVDLKCSSAKGGVRYQFALKIGDRSWEYFNYGTRSIYVYDFPRNKILRAKVRAYKEVDGVKYYGKWSPVTTETSKWKQVFINTFSPNSSYVKGYVKNAYKGEILKIQIGKKTITKKIKKNGKYSFNVRIGKPKAGKTVKISLLSKYKDTITYCTKTSYYSKIKKGFTKNQVRYTKYWGSPDDTASASGGWSYWYYDDGSYVGFKNGKVRFWYFA